MFRWLALVVFFTTALSVQALNVSILISQYYSIDKSLEPYLEVYLHTIASTVDPLPSSSGDGLMEKKIKVLILFKQNNDIVNYDNFIIESGRKKEIEDFVTLKRYGMKPGEYNIEFTLADLANTNNEYRDSVTVRINSAPEHPFLSNLQLVADTTSSADEHIAKNGIFYELIPYGYMSPAINRFGLYFESYNTDQLATDIVNYHVKISKRINNTYKLVGRTALKRRSARIDDILAWFDVTYYESGQYNIMVYLSDKDRNTIDSAEYYFTKSNPVRDEAILSKKFMDEVETSFAGKLSRDQLNYTLRAIAMNVINSDVELVNRLIKDDNVIAKSNYIYKYFKEKSALHPEEYYTQYMEVAKAVDKKYKTGFGYGFESDRGLIFMKYGKPSDMICITDDPSCAPYEIWQYNEVPKLMQSNVKFLFFNPFLDGMDYRLLQSNARGEMRNPNWKKELYKTVATNPENQASERYEVPKGFNRQAEEWLQDL